MGLKTREYTSNYGLPVVADYPSYQGFYNVEINTYMYDQFS